MYILINLLIFCCVLFFYIHIYYHIKTSNSLEIYEVDNVSKEKLEEICDLKQPVILKNQFVDYYTNDIHHIDIDFLKSNYGAFDIKIYNKEEFDMPLPMNLNLALELFKKDTSCNYMSENNCEFLEETTLDKNFGNIDLFLRPRYVSNIYYDMIIGTPNSYTKLKYVLNYRNFYYINSGSVEVTLCAPNNYSKLYVNNNNELLEYYSDIDINNVEDKYKKDFDKVKLMRIILTRGQLLYIPYYWFYSIKLLEENTVLLSLKYRTYMNSISIIPQLFVKFLQDHNIKRNVIKIIGTQQ